MRLRRQDMTVLNFRPRANEFDDEGNPIKGWGTAVEFQANVQPASGRLSTQMYGERVTYMKSLKYQGDLFVEAKNEGDGVCVNVAADHDPDYRIVSIETWSTHQNILIERLERGTDGA